MRQSFLMVFSTIAILMSLLSCRYKPGGDAEGISGETGENPENIRFSFEMLPSAKTLLSSEESLYTPSSTPKLTSQPLWPIPSEAEMDDLFWGGFISKSASQDQFSPMDKKRFWGTLIKEPAGYDAAISSYTLDNFMRIMASSTKNQCLISNLVPQFVPKETFIAEKEDKIFEIRAKGTGFYPFFEWQFLKVVGTDKMGNSGGYEAIVYACNKDTVAYKHHFKISPSNQGNQWIYESVLEQRSGIKLSRQSVRGVVEDKNESLHPVFTLPRSASHFSTDPMPLGWGSAKSSLSLLGSDFEYRSVNINKEGRFHKRSWGSFFPDFELGMPIHKIFKKEAIAVRSHNLGMTTTYDRIKGFEFEPSLSLYLNSSNQLTVDLLKQANFQQDQYYISPEEELSSFEDLDCKPKLTQKIVVDRSNPAIQEIGYQCTYDMDDYKLDFLRYPSIEAARIKALQP